MSKRFTIDGSPELEARLQRICDSVRREVTALILERNVTAIVLGGGYGRGEGGVLRTDSGDEPYNDLEFYVFLNGHRLWQGLPVRQKSALQELGRWLSEEAGINVEFKIDGIETMETRTRVT